MDTDVVSLAALLDEAEALLRKHGISHWADWLKKDSRLVRAGDAAGLEHFLSAFGGMGSLNDLGLAELSKENPKVLVTSPDDAKFQSLLAEAHSKASALLREHLGGQARA